jgi:DNA-binding response OmpR family regulator
MALSLLLVEDTKTIAESIKQYLELDGHSVTRVDHWSYANELVKHQNFDIVLLDLMLPWVDWITIAKTIRSVHPETPILMMTAKGQLDDKLEGFEAWADDYLVKPFDLEELEARVLALAKRLPKKEELVFEDVRLDLNQKKVFKWDEELKFSLKEFQILEMLMQNQWIAISRLDIIEEIWWGEAGFEEDGKLDVYLSTIRRKIGKDRIETIKWFWYRMNK